MSKAFRVDGNWIPWEELQSESCYIANSFQLKLPIQKGGSFIFRKLTKLTRSRK